jgi:hypothetical protein
LLTMNISIAQSASAGPVPDSIPNFPRYPEPQSTQAERGMPYASNDPLDEAYRDLRNVVRERSPSRAPSPPPRKRLSTWGGRAVNWFRKLTPIEVRLQGKDWAYEPHIEAVLDRFGCDYEKSERKVYPGFSQGASWSCVYGNEGEPEYTQFSVCLVINGVNTTSRQPWSVLASCSCTSGNVTKFKEIGGAIIRKVRSQPYYDGVRALPGTYLAFPNYY